LLLIDTKDKGVENDELKVNEIEKRRAPSIGLAKRFIQAFP